MAGEEATAWYITKCHLRGVWCFRFSSSFCVFVVGGGCYLRKKKKTTLHNDVVAQAVVDRESMEVLIQRRCPYGCHVTTYMRYLFSGDVIMKI